MLKENFVQLISQIVYAEMNENEQNIFVIEGPEWIDQLLGVSPESQNTTSPVLKNIGLGISSDALDIIKTASSCGALILSCVSFYFIQKKEKGTKLKSEVEKLDALKKLKGFMEEQNMSPELIERINIKYSSQIINVLDGLS